MGCVHHWIIDPPEGPTSAGVCARCGESRQFRNSPRAGTGTGEGPGCWGTEPAGKEAGERNIIKGRYESGGAGNTQHRAFGRLDRRV